MSINSSDKYYQDNKERLQKMSFKNIKIFLNTKNKKSDNMVMKDTNILQRMKNKSWFSGEKNIIK